MDYLMDFTLIATDNNNYVGKKTKLQILEA